MLLPYLNRSTLSLETADKATMLIALAHKSKSVIVFYAVFAGSEVTAMIFPPLRYATDAAK